jgi:hypothetical protein
MSLKISRIIDDYSWIFSDYGGLIHLSEYRISYCNNIFEIAVCESLPIYPKLTY